MHALFIRFHSSAPGPQLMGLLPPDWMPNMIATDGLVMKTYVGASENELGGFYLFDSAESATAYLEGETWNAVAGLDAVSDIRIERFHVADEPSALCGTPLTRAA